jgi:hyperosmotically inducible periplasmic protein
MLRRGFVLIVVSLVAAVSVALAQPAGSEQQTVESIRSALLRLPYYGVFDFLAFRYDRGTVTISGYAYRSQLKKDAVNAVKRLRGVDEVIDKIEELSIGPHDDAIRWATFYKIYNDNSLSRYAPGGPLYGVDRRFDMIGFPGMQPLGMYPIHIVVNRGRILLVGAVDSEADKALAGLRASGIPQVVGVENALEVVR